MTVRELIQYLMEKEVPMEAEVYLHHHAALHDHLVDLDEFDLSFHNPLPGVNEGPTFVIG